MIKIHKNIFTQSGGDVLAVFVFLCLSATYASFFGFVSIDSWNYISLVQALENENTCVVNKKYFAIFPCGYPILLSFLSFAENAATIIITSKFANTLLLFGGFLCLRQLIYQNSLVAALIVLAPSTISVAHFTWSENLLFFSISLTLLQIHKLSTKQSYGCQLILFFALLLGISSRYFFAPFSFLIWFSTIFIYGKNVALRLLPIFMLCGIFFAIYYIFNYSMTGFGTGMERIPAPESLIFLSALFFWTLVNSELISIIIVITFLYLLGKDYKNLNLVSIKYVYQQKNIILLLVAGFFFLLLSFALRLYTQFDLFNSRTVGYGFTFVASATYAFFAEHSKNIKKKFIIVFLMGVLSFSIVKRGELKDHINSVIGGTFSYISVAEQIKLYEKRSTVKKFDNIVSFRIPPVGKIIAGSDPEYFYIAENYAIYYGILTNVIRPYKAPYENREGLDSFLNRIKKAEGSCVVDFSSFASKDDFFSEMKSFFYTDIDFKILRSYSVSEIIKAFFYNNKLAKSLLVTEFVYDQELANFMIDQYKHAKVTDCKDLFVSH